MIAVIGIIISILLPSLAGARGAARTTVCRANLRSLAAMATAYSGDYDGWIAGSPKGSGWDAMAGPTGRIAQVGNLGRTQLVQAQPTFNGITVQGWDWMGPLLSSAGISGPGESIDRTPGDTQDDARSDRFNWYRNDVEFLQCPENIFESTPFPANSTRFETGRMIAYNMSTQFTSTGHDAPFGTEQRRNDRGNYTPRDYSVGPSSTKALFFEGHRYARGTNGPDFHYTIDAPFGGAFQDTGPWYNESKALDRTHAPGEPTRGVTSGIRGLRDTRAMGFRHNRKPKGELYDDVYGAIAFFDGHVEVMTDLEATNPEYWFPTGTRLEGPGEFWHTTRERFSHVLGGDHVSE